MVGALMKMEEQISKNEVKTKTIRRVKVSKQRQINIPKDFFEALNFADEAYMEFNGKELIIRPLEYDVVDFSVDILKDLVKQNYSGEELIAEFKKIKTNIPKALEQLKREAMNNPIGTGSLDDYLDSFKDDSGDE